MPDGNIIETHERLSPIERYKLLAEQAKEAVAKEQAARDAAVEQLQQEIQERIALLNECGFHYSLVDDSRANNATEVIDELPELRLQEYPSPSPPETPVTPPPPPGRIQGYLRPTPPPPQSAPDSVRAAKIALLAKAREAKAQKKKAGKAGSGIKGRATLTTTPFGPGTQTEWIYQQIARNGKPVHVTDILRAAAATPDRRNLVQVPNRLTVALNQMMRKGAIERVGDRLYSVKGARH